MSSSSPPPWKRPAPKKAGPGHTKLTKESKAKARAAAKHAGRRYPNLVDNMRAAQEQREKSDQEVMDSNRRRTGKQQR
ncbi:hypothetical protein [Verrucomicrobium sp. BvORR106]|uniref:hypothetical protein n=1 Tax=Verrucomicrobium sp. BvORR106 TaxID=1403819 RepID=UPI0009DEF553|nr:hypothetical protein [Verrucomicrobium sp. BvORR106]